MRATIVQKSAVLAMGVVVLLGVVGMGCATAGTAPQPGLP